MGYMSNFTGKYANFVASKEKGKPRTAASVEDETKFKRIDRKDLENTYLQDPQTFNTVNKIKQLIMQAGFEITADKKQAQSKYNDFFENIGTIGLKMDNKQLVDSITHDACLYGHAYVERIYNVSDTEIVDLKMIDAKLMDYARNEDNQIVTDSEQNPIGYVMYIGYNTKFDSGDYVPLNVKVDTEFIYLAAKRIAHFKMFSYGNRFESIGIVEPAYLDIKRKKKIETAATNSIHNTAAYPVIGYVGSETRHASKKQMEATLDTLQHLQSSRYMVFENPTEIKSLEVKHSEQIGEVLRYLRTNQSAASGMALGFSVGTGEAINRSTLGVQQRMLDLSLESIADHLASQYNKLILDVLDEVNGYGSKAKLTFGNIVAEEKNDKINRLISAVESGILAPKEARKYVLSAEEIEPDESAFKKHSESSKRKPKKIPDKPFPDKELDEKEEQ